VRESLVAGLGFADVAGGADSGKSVLCSPCCAPNTPAGGGSNCRDGIACSRHDCLHAHPSPALICLALAPERETGDEDGLYGNWSEDVYDLKAEKQAVIELESGARLRLRAPSERSAASERSAVDQQRRAPLTISVNLMSTDEFPGAGTGGKLAAGAPESPALAIGEQLTDLRQGLRGGKRKEPGDAGVGGGGVGGVGGAVARSLILTEEEEPAKRQRCRDVSELELEREREWERERERTREAVPSPLPDSFPAPPARSKCISRPSLAGEGGGCLIADYAQPAPSGASEIVPWAGGGGEIHRSPAAPSEGFAVTTAAAVEGGGGGGEKELDSRRRLRELCKQHHVEEKGMEMCDFFGVESIEDLEHLEPEDVKEVADCCVWDPDASLIAVCGAAMYG